MLIAKNPTCFHFILYRKDREKCIKEPFAKYGEKLCCCQCLESAHPPCCVFDLPVGRLHTVGKAENMSVAQVMEEVQDDQRLLGGINLHCVLLSNKGKVMTLENINKCKYMYKGKRL